MTKIIKNEWFRKTDQWIDCLITYRWVSFCNFAFVDHSNKANERLADQKQEEKDKKKEKLRNKKTRKRKIN